MQNHLLHLVMQSLQQTKNMFLDQLSTFRLPAEWERHEATWLSWPQNSDTWAHFLPKVQQAYIQFIKVISTKEKVNLLLSIKNVTVVRELLQQADCAIENIQLHTWDTNDAWMRDCGPDFLIDEKKKEKIIINWEYNAWGGKYPPYQADNMIPKRVAKHLNIPYISPNIILEGGSFDPNGKGSVLTTESCLLHENRNPHLSKKQIEHYLIDYLQIGHVIWLEDGIVGDDTDGHIDDMTRFVASDVILTCVEENKKDSNYIPLNNNLQRLRSARLENGKQATIMTLPMPSPFIYNGQRLPASYANFYICNAAVIVPVFNDPMDQKAIDILEPFFTEREVIPIYAGDIIYGLGSFHCLSKHEPYI